MDVHQCPRCELRFLSRNELEDHLRDEHPSPLDTDEQHDHPHPPDGDGA